VVLSGTAAAMSTAFRVKLLDYEHLTVTASEVRTAQRQGLRLIGR
jgi:hypothetical protein